MRGTGRKALHQQIDRLAYHPGETRRKSRILKQFYCDAQFSKIVIGQGYSHLIYHQRSISSQSVLFR